MGETCFFAFVWLKQHLTRWKTKVLRSDWDPINRTSSNVGQRHVVSTNVKCRSILCCMSPPSPRLEQHDFVRAVETRVCLQRTSPGGAQGPCDSYVTWPDARRSSKTIQNLNPISENPPAPSWQQKKHSTITSTLLFFPDQHQPLSPPVPGPICSDPWVFRGSSPSAPRCQSGLPGAVMGGHAAADPLRWPWYLRDINLGPLCKLHREAEN